MEKVIGFMTPHHRRNLAKLAVLSWLLLAAHPVSAQLLEPVDREREAIRARAEADIAAARAASSAADDWQDVGMSTTGCDRPASASCALVDTTTALNAFCLSWTSQDAQTGCAGLAEQADGVDPTRLARAIALASGDWDAPSDDEVDNADPLSAQVRADADALTSASAAAERNRKLELDMSGPAIAPARASTGSNFFRTLTESLIDTLEPRDTQSDQPRQLSPSALRNLIADPMTCDDLQLPDAFTPLEMTELTLPQSLHGTEPLSAAIGMGGLPVPLFSQRVGQTKLRLMMPFHIDDLQGGLGFLSISFADAGSDVSRYCRARATQIGPPTAPQGSFIAFLDGLEARRDAAGDLAQALGTVSPLTTPINDRDEMLATYQDGTVQERQVLDAIAHALQRNGLDPAEDAQHAQQFLGLISAPDPGDQGFLFDDGPDRIWRATGHLVPSTRVVADSCPADAVEMLEFIRIGSAGRYAGSPEGKALLSGISMTSSLSAQFAATAVGGDKVGDIASKSVGLAFVGYGLYMDFVKGMMPSSLPIIEANISNTTIYEDEPDLRVEVTDVRLTSRSAGWDGNKAAMDTLIAIGTTLSGRSISGNAKELYKKAFQSKASGTATQSVVNQATRQAAEAAWTREFASEVLLLAEQELGKGALGIVAGIIEGFAIDEAYNRSKPDGEWGLYIPPQDCTIGLYDDWFINRLDDPDLVYSFVDMHSYRPVRDGTAEIRVQPNPEKLWGGLDLPKAVTTLTVPQFQIMPATYPGVVQPGDPLTLGVDIVNVSSGFRRVEWEFPSPATVSHRVGPQGLNVHLATSRNPEDYPLLAEARAVGNFLPQSEAPDRVARFVVEPGRLFVVPTRNCIEPGGSVQILVFDGITDELIPPHDLVFHTDTSGIDVDGAGMMRSTRRDDYVTVYARGVGANGWRGQRRIRADCRCGTRFFNDRMIDDALIGAFSPYSARIDDEQATITSGIGGTRTFAFPTDTFDLFSLKGHLTVSITGDVSAFIDRPDTFDLLTIKQTGPRGPACSYLSGGMSGTWMGTRMHIGTQGTLSGFDVSDGADLPVHSHDKFLLDLEDFDRSLEGYMMARPTSPPHVRIEKWRHDEVVVTATGQFEADRINSRGSITFNYTGRFEARP